MVTVPVVKNILTPLGVRAAVLVINAGIQKIMDGSGMTTLITLNKEMNDIMKIFKLLKIVVFY